ncbi:MAG: hypothetical protein ACK559_14770, partial [bacterium]
RGGCARALHRRHGLRGRGLGHRVGAELGGAVGAGAQVADVEPRVERGDLRRGLGPEGLADHLPCRREFLRVPEVRPERHRARGRHARPLDEPAVAPDGARVARAGTARVGRAQVDGGVAL